MVGSTKREKECYKCMGMNACYCDGAGYLGGMCSCDSHKEADKLYEYNNGRPRKRVVLSGGKK